MVARKRSFWEVARSDDPGNLPYLLFYGLSAVETAAQAAWTAIDRIVTRMDPGDLGQLERDLRYHSPSRAGLSFRVPVSDKRLRNAWLNILAEGVTQAGLASFHYNGYLREDAVRVLVENSSGREVPFLILRLRDNVPEVRALAEEAIRDRLTPVYTPYFDSCFSLVLQVAASDACRRSGLPVKILNHVVATCADPAAWMKNLIFRSKQECRWFFSMLSGTGPHRHGVLRAALTSSNAMVRQRAFLSIKSNPADFRDDLLPLLAQDPLPTIRKEALLMRIQTSGEPEADQLRAYLLDPAARIREIAFYYYRKQGSDPAEFYRECLDSGDPGNLVSAIMGLSEVGVQEDAERAAEYLDHTRTTVRRAALACLGRLNPEGYLAEIVRELGNPEGGMAKTAFRVLSSHANCIASKELWRIFREAHHPRIAKYVLLLFACKQLWEAWPYLVRATHCDDEMIVGIAARLERVMADRESYLEPTSAQIRALAEARSITRSFKPLWKQGRSNPGKSV